MENTVQTEPIDVRSEDFADFMADYPFASEVDSLQDLPLQVFIATNDGETFAARVLGFGSSYKGETHRNHAPGTRPNGSCSRCRWTDTAILWCEARKYYVFTSFGKSIVPGEQRFDTIVWTQDAEVVLRQCFVPTKAEFTRDRGTKAIPPHNADAFRQAAVHDPAFADLLARYEQVIPAVDERGPDADPLAGL